MLVYQPPGRYVNQGAAHALQFKEIVLIKPVPQELLQFLYGLQGARAMTQALTGSINIVRISSRTTGARKSIIS